MPNERLLRYESEQEPGTRSAELAGLLSLLPEEYGFDDETLEEIAGLPFVSDNNEDALSTAVSFLDSDGRIDGEHCLCFHAFHFYLEAPEWYGM